MLFKTAWLPEIVARIFAQQPRRTIWEWADDDNVFLTGKDAAEPGFYKSENTPWTRRLQELAKNPVHRGHRIRKIVVKKSSQSGFTEAVLNCIRWFAKFSPRNVIYAINSREEVTNITARLKHTLEALGEELFTGDDDDMGKFKMILRHMIIWFLGSYSAGNFANKQAPFCVCDEAEEHAKIAGDTSTVVNLYSRLKNADEGLLVVISKPKLAGGVIDTEHAAGNQEIFLVPCPFCETYQELVFEQLKYSHCRNLLGEWDLERVMRETHFECVATYCKKAIGEHYKPWMVARGHWYATTHGDPEVISQHISDLYSLKASVSWGSIAKSVIQAKHNRRALQGIWNQNLGLEWKEKVAKAEESDIIKCRWPYKRGTIPWPPAVLDGVVAVLLGADVGKNYARYVIGAVNAANDLAIIDWAEVSHPDDIAAVVGTRTFFCPIDDSTNGIAQGLLDAKHRVEDCYAACMKAPGVLWPCMGAPGTFHSRKGFKLNELPDYPSWFKMITFNDRDFKTELYLERIKREVPPHLVTVEEQEKYRATMPRLLVPENVTQDLIKELCNEHLVEERDKETGELTGEMKWERKGPNHYGDCIKEICLLWRFLTREQHRVPEPPAEVKAAA